MKRKTLVILTLVTNLIISSLFSGCLKNKDKTQLNTYNNMDQSVLSLQNNDEDNITPTNTPSPTPFTEKSIVNDSVSDKVNSETTPKSISPTPSPSLVPKAARPSSSKSPVNEVSAKQLSGQVSSQEIKVSSEEAFYKAVVASVSQGEDLVVTLSDSIKVDGIADRIIKILEDTGYSGYISGIEYITKNSTLSVRYNYNGGKENFLSKIKAVNAKVQEIASKIIKPGMSDFEKELAIHDYIVNNTRYDYKNLNNNTLPDDSFSAYGALIKGIAVCGGYAEAVYRILNSVGVETLIVTGFADNTPHAWNIVKINGEYYHLDATFNDPISSSGDLLTYNYFNLTDAQISKDHVWISSDYPKCTSTSANYFVYNKLIANNKADFYNIIKKGLHKKESIIRIKTASYDPSIYTPNTLYDVLKENPDINYVNTSEGFSYTYSQTSNVIEFYINYK